MNEPIVIIGCDAGLHPLAKVTAIVLVIAVVSGFQQAMNPFWMLMLLETGHSHEYASWFFLMLSLISSGTALGLGILNLAVSYYSGKQYRLTKNSTLIAFLLLLVTVLIGGFIGYIIAQLLFPQYQIIHMMMFANYGIGLFYVSPILWSFVGLFAGNYKRELESNRMRFTGQN